MVLIAGRRETGGAPSSPARQACTRPTSSGLRRTQIGPRAWGRRVPSACTTGCIKKFHVLLNVVSVSSLAWQTCSFSRRRHRIRRLDQLCSALRARPAYSAVRIHSPSHAAPHFRRLSITPQAPLPRAPAPAFTRQSPQPYAFGPPPSALLTRVFAARRTRTTGESRPNFVPCQVA